VNTNSSTKATTELLRHRGMAMKNGLRQAGMAGESKPWYRDLHA